MTQTAQNAANAALPAPSTTTPATDIPQTSTPPPPPLPPQQSSGIFMKGNELLRAVDTPVGPVYLPIAKPPEPPPTLLTKLHKIPLSLYRQMLGFLLWTQEVFSAEGLIYAFHHPEHGWKVEPPEQTTNGMTVSADDTALETTLAPLGYTLRFTAHHHCTSNAFQSGTDKTDEHSKPSGLHITLGELQKPTLSYHGRIVVRVGTHVHQYDLPLHDFGKHIAFDNLPPEYSNVEHLLYPLLLNPSSKADFPSEWKERIHRPKPETPTSFQGGNFQGMTQHTSGTTPGGNQTTTKQITLVCGPIDSRLDLGRLRGATQNKPLSHFIPMIASRIDHSYDCRVLLTYLCIAYPGQQVLLAIEKASGIELRFRSEAILDQYLLLHKFADQPYDISGETVSVLTAERMAHLSTLKGTFTINTKNFTQYTASNVIEAQLALLERVAAAPPPTPLPNNTKPEIAMLVIDTLPPSNYYPKHLKKAVSLMTKLDVCRLFLSVKQVYEPALLMLLVNHFALPYILKSLEEQDIYLEFETDRLRVIYSCLALGDDTTVYYRKNTICTSDPGIQARCQTLIDSHALSGPPLKVKPVTVAQITNARTVLPKATLETLEQLVGYDPRDILK